MTRKKLLIGLIIVVVLGGMAWANLSIKRPSGVTINVEKIEARDLEAQVTASGKVQPRRTVKVSNEASGKDHNALSAMQSECGAFTRSRMEQRGIHAVEQDLRGPPKGNVSQFTLDRLADEHDLVCTHQHASGNQRVGERHEPTHRRRPEWNGGDVLDQD